MPARQQWDDEEGDSSTPASSPPLNAARRRQFGDEEDDSDVLESWDAAEDSEVEREKERKAAEAKAQAAAEAAANKKSKTQRVADHQAERARQRAADDDDSEEEEEETKAERRQRLLRSEQDADLRHAEDLFAEVGISSGRKAPTVGTAVVVDSKDPTGVVNLAVLPLFNPQTKTQFEQLRTTIAPLVAGNAKKAQYGLFLEEFVKDLSKEMSSDQIKKVASALTRLGNEKMKEEKSADKGGKKTKAAKTKTSLVTSRANTTDVATYDEDAFGDDDFM